MAKTEEYFWISQIIIQNYKSINDETIELKPHLNIIIGKNGAGKSNLLQFINLNCKLINLFESRRTRLARSNFRIQYSSDVNSSQKTSYAVKIEKSVIKDENGNNDFSTLVSIETKVNGDVLESDKVEYSENMGSQFKKVRELILKSMPFLRLFKLRLIPFNIPKNNYLTWLESPASFNFSPESGIYFDDYSLMDFFSDYEFESEKKLLNNSNDSTESDNESIKTFLIDDFYKYSHRLRFINQIRNYTPVQDIRLNENINISSKENNILVENLTIQFLINNSWVAWNHLSDGTKRMFYLISQTYNIEKGLILIEEPELGIHPSQLYQIMDYLKNKAFQNQIIITTHSPLVLDILDAEELTNIIIAKMLGHGTSFSHLSDAKLSKAKKYMTETGNLSNYWLHSDLEDD